MRRNELMNEVDESGQMNFRAHRLMNDPPYPVTSAIDGQCGSVARLHREWWLSGDDALIEELGPSALRALDGAIRKWDPQAAGMPEGPQHNTYDIEFYGANSLSATMYLTGLLAGQLIAHQLGLPEKEAEYARLYALGQEQLEARCWNGEYYAQRLDDVDAFRYQYGNGCLSDQLVGHFMSLMTGLGPILPEEKVMSALRSVYQYNFVRRFRDFSNVQRAFAVNDESGLVLCTWPHGGRPRFPMVYCDEVWTGVEYQVAATMIVHGLVNEGLDIVKAVRARFDGHNRNPFDENECGHHYVRAMASWALLLALSGCSRMAPGGELRFDPKLTPQDFKAFFSDANSWGVYIQKDGGAHLDVRYKKGELDSLLGGSHAAP